MCWDCYISIWSEQQNQSSEPLKESMTDKFAQGILFKQAAKL